MSHEIKLDKKYYPKLASFPTAYVIPRVIGTRDAEDVVWFEDPSNLFVPDDTGMCPLPVWGFLDSFTTRKRKPKKEEEIVAVGPRKTSRTGDGDKRFKHNEDMLTRAFDLSDGWVEQTQDYIDESVGNESKITQVALGLVKKIRYEELNEPTLSNFSDYEMKLFYAGFLLSQAAEASRTGILLGEIIVDLFTSFTDEKESQKENDSELDGIIRLIEELRKKRKDDENKDNND